MSSEIGLRELSLCVSQLLVKLVFLEATPQFPVSDAFHDAIHELQQSLSSFALPYNL